MTEEQIRADERRRWAIFAFMLVLDAKNAAHLDPLYEKVWKFFIVFAHRLLDNDGPTPDEMKRLAERLKEEGFHVDG
jgi:hypothetical protein